MANTTGTSAAGSDFDGQPANGEVAFDGTELLKDSTRAKLFSISVTTDGTTLTQARAVLAPDRGSAVGSGPFLELAIVNDSAGFTMACCDCVVPAGWKLFFFTTESAATEKKFFADWSIETLIPRF